MLGTRSLGTHGLGDSTGQALSGAGSVEVALGLIWSARQALADSVALNWSVRAALSDTLGLVWDVRAAVPDSLGLVWHTKAALSDTLDLQWGVRTAVSPARLELVWRVFKNLEDAERLPYYKVGPRHARILVRGNQ